MGWIWIAGSTWDFSQVEYNSHKMQPFFIRYLKNIILKFRSRRSRNTTHRSFSRDENPGRLHVTPFWVFATAKSYFNHFTKDRKYDNDMRDTMWKCMPPWRAAPPHFTAPNDPWTYSISVDCLIDPSPNLDYNCCQFRLLAFCCMINTHHLITRLTGDHRKNPRDIFHSWCRNRGIHSCICRSHCHTVDSRRRARYTSKSDKLNSKKPQKLSLYLSPFMKTEKKEKRKKEPRRKPTYLYRSWHSRKCLWRNARRRGPRCCRSTGHTDRLVSHNRCENYSRSPRRISPLSCVEMKQKPL